MGDPAREASGGDCISWSGGLDSRKSLVFGWEMTLDHSGSCHYGEVGWMASTDAKEALCYVRCHEDSSRIVSPA